MGDLGESCHFAASHRVRRSASTRPLVPVFGPRIYAADFVTIALRARAACNLPPYPIPRTIGSVADQALFGNSECDLRYDSFAARSGSSAALTRIVLPICSTF